MEIKCSSLALLEDFGSSNINQIFGFTLIHQVNVPKTRKVLNRVQKNKRLTLRSHEAKMLEKRLFFDS